MVPSSSSLNSGFSNEDSLDIVAGGSASLVVLTILFAIVAYMVKRKNKSRKASSFSSSSYKSKFYQQQQQQKLPINTGTILDFYIFLLVGLLNVPQWYIFTVTLSTLQLERSAVCYENECYVTAHLQINVEWLNPISTRIFTDLDFIRGY